MEKGKHANTFEELTQITLKGYNRPNSFTITFDDANESVYTKAYPFLKAHSIPFIVFITKELIGKPNFLSKEQIVEMANDSLCTIGSHALQHKMFRYMTANAVLIEYNESRIYLQQLTGQSIDCFAFPYGRLVEVSCKNIKLLEQTSYKFAFSAIACVLIVPALAWLPAPDTSGVTKSGAAMHDNPPSRLFLGIFMAAYFCAGFGYVISATFIVAIVDQLPGLAGQGALAFLAIGLAATPACFNWDLIARYTGDINALILAAALQIVGIILPVAVGGLLPTLFGALLFGGTFIGMVSLVLTMAGRYYPTRPAKMMGKMTLSYGAAQIIGPAIVGWLATRLGNYSIGLYIAAGVMVLGVMLLVILKMVEKQDAEAALTSCPQH